MTEITNRPTPETDAFAEAVHEGHCLPTCDSFAHDEKCPVCNGEYLIADHARRLEQQRDALREALETLLKLDDQMNAEDNEEKGTYAGAYYAYYKGAYETWKEARAILAATKGEK